MRRDVQDKGEECSPPSKKRPRDTDEEPAASIKDQDIQSDKDQDGSDEGDDSSSDNKTRVNYREEMSKAIASIMEHEAHLLDQGERKLVENYCNLSIDAQKLYLRLLQRNHRWIRMNRLLVPMGTAECLGRMTLARTDLRESLQEDAEMMELLTLNELRDLGKSFIDLKVSKTRKQVVLALLSSISKPQATIDTFFVRKTAAKVPSRHEQFFLLALARIGECIRLNDTPRSFFLRLLLVHYRNCSNPERPFKSYILDTVSSAKYPDYKYARTSDLFPDRPTLIEWEYYLRLDYDLEVTMSSFPREEIVEMLQPHYIKWKGVVKDCKCSPKGYFLNQFHPGWYMCRVVEKYADALDKLKQDNEAAEVFRSLLTMNAVYRLSKRGKWWDRLALIQHKRLKMLAGALATCENALKDPLVRTGDAKALQKRHMALEKELKVSFSLRKKFPSMSNRQARKRTFCGIKLSKGEIGRKSLWEGSNGEPLTVEDFALEKYAEDGWRGFHCENSIATSLFALLFWDILFMDIPGVFESPYQTRPLDLFTEGFYYSRKPEIEQRLVDIANNDYFHYLVIHYQSNFETLCAGMSWKVELEDFLQVSECLGPLAVCGICRLYAENYRENRGGLPDLWMWKHSETEKVIKLVEVKGKGDVFSSQQKNWQEWLLFWGLDVEECHVDIDRKNTDSGTI